MYGQLLPAGRDNWGTMQIDVGRTSINAARDLVADELKKLGAPNEGKVDLASVERFPALERSVMRTVISEAQKKEKGPASVKGARAALELMATNAKKHAQRGHITDPATV